LEHLDKYSSLIAKSILSNKAWDIKEVRSLEVIKMVNFSKEEYKQVEALLRTQDLIAVTQLPEIQKQGFQEDLLVVKFKNQNESEFIATVYDSDELWQDPDVIDIFPLNIS
jgi:hypothetical protein